MVTPATTRNVKLTACDLVIFREHLPRFRVTTTDALLRLFFESKPAIKNWVRKMTQGGYIDTITLTGERSNAVYFLTPQAVERLNERADTPTANVIPDLLRSPPKEGNIHKLFGMLAFCCLGERQFTKIHAEQFAGEFPNLAAQGAQADAYYLDPDFEDDKHPACKRLGIICVDVRNSVSRMVDKIHQRIAIRKKSRLWEQAIFLNDRLIIAVVTYDPHKATRIRETLNEAAPHEVPVRIEVRESLRNILPPGQNRR